MTVLITLENELRFLFWGLSPEARTSVAWSAVLLFYSCLLMVIDSVFNPRWHRIVLVSGDSDGASNGNPKRTMDPNERRLRLMVLNDEATVRRLIDLEIMRGAATEAEAVRKAADRLEWEKSR